ncbi:MAG TPA: thioesterase family protein [Thermoanaerobaculia bacterium]|nr:thioesterase family protein [Thermoanaerobaculia bacterium]
MDDYPVRVPITLHWADMDALGHVNNARYFTFFETARMALFERVGLAAAGQPEIGPILAHTRCDFLAPVRYPADLVAGTSIERIGNTSFTMGYAVAHAGGDVVARGQGVVVLIDYRSETKVAIPGELREKLAALGPAG